MSVDGPSGPRRSPSSADSAERRSRVETERNVNGSANSGIPTSVSTSGSTSSHHSAGSVSTTGEVGGFDTEAHAEGPSLDFEASHDVDIGLDGVDIELNVDIEANLASAGASATRTVEFEIGGEQFTAEIDLGAEGNIGADGHLNLDVHLGTDGSVEISASAEGFAGVRAELSGGITIKHEGDEMASGSITLSASAGASADAHANIGLDGDEISFDVGAEATVGVGLGVDVEGSVDVSETLEAIGKVAVGLGGEILENAGEAVLDAGGWVADRASDALDSVLPGHWP